MAEKLSIPAIVLECTAVCKDTADPLIFKEGGPKTWGGSVYVNKTLSNEIVENWSVDILVVHKFAEFYGQKPGFYRRSTKIVAVRYPMGKNPKRYREAMCEQEKCSLRKLRFVEVPEGFGDFPERREKDVFV